MKTTHTFGSNNSTGVNVSQRNKNNSIRRFTQIHEEMVGWHHRLDGHEFEQTPGVDDGQGSLACCSPWGPKESAMTERLNNNNNKTTEATL